jgi:hypothetical protein
VDASRPSRAWAILGSLLILGLLVIAGCVSVRTTGASSVKDLQAEDVYNAAYATHITKVHADSLVLQPTASTPGVCNRGGTKQGCFDADAVLIRDLRETLDALAATDIPPRYLEPDRLLRQAISEDIRGLELRNKAIAENDDAAWTEHKIVLDQAIADLKEAHLAFPADNRPAPAP